MQHRDYINQRVHDLYWNDDLNCTITTLLILSEIFHISLNPQILDASIGVPGAGRYGAQCGLVAGALMFIGIHGKQNRLEDEAIVNKCNNLGKEFEKIFGSLNCRDLRPEGFKPENPPHLCEEITKKAIMFTLKYLISDKSISN